ncbi:MAG: GAF domain-containing sensor histidine kinase [Chloroflexi bacterium]|nr:GAF domain-containing sensor histidine kinase [Chloroflexota bacterium]
MALFNRRQAGRWGQRTVTDDAQSQAERFRARVDSFQQLHQSIQEADDERDFMNRALEIVCKLCSSMACSFVPLDDLGQALPGYVQGELPAAVLKNWPEHVASQAVRQRCKVCQPRMAGGADHCPLLDGPFESGFNVYCLPLKQEDRLMGMMNIYMPAGQTLEEEQRAFVAGLLNIISVVVQNIRLHKQHVATRRELQTSRSFLVELPGKIEETLRGLLLTTGMEAGVFQLAGDHPATIKMKVHVGREEFYLPGTLEFVLDRIARGESCFEAASDLDPGRPVTVIAAAVRSPKGHFDGGLFLTSRQPSSAPELHLQLVKNEGGQITYLLESQQEALTLEYQSVLNERARLAREIHDGLAQTLAYLKLQTAQMQNLLQKGDLHRLGQVIVQNHQSLAEAYLDTRMAIDNLRLMPHSGLARWLGELTDDFQETSGIPVSLRIELREENLAPEIQAQLMRIIQEALNNIRKHARARRAWVHLEGKNRDVVLEVKDDGIGFSPKDVPDLSRFGLRGMRERAEFIGGDFQIESQPGKGTSVIVRLPLAEGEML